MDLIKICEFLSASNLRNYRDDDLWIDRLSHRYSVVIFTLFAVLVTSKAYIGDPIDCWAPPEFKASYERYAETLCFVNGTYYISASEIEIPNDPKSRYSNRIRYYQWTPFILLLQAFCMYTPRLIWHSLNTRCGINLHNLVDASKKYETVDSCSNKERILGYICKNLLRSINYKDYNLTTANEFRRIELAKMLSSISGESNGDKAGTGGGVGDKKKQPAKFSAVKFSSSPAEEEEEEDEEETEEDNYNQISHSASDDVFLNDQEDSSTPKPKTTTTTKKKKEVNFKEEKPPRDVAKLLKTLKMLDSTRSYAVVDEQMNQVSSGQLNIIRSEIRKRYLRKIRKDEDEENDEYGATHPSLINVLKSKITHVSKKHFFNFISSGYESSSKSLESPMTDNDEAAAATAYDTNLVNIESPELTKESRFNVFANKHNYLSGLYLFVRLLYILSSISQVILLNRLIGNDFYMIGIKLIDSFLNETEWPQLAVFPRSTLCEIHIREIGAIHPYLIQCVLRINLFNEVIFVLVWYWLLFLLVIGIFDFVVRLVALLVVCPNCQRKLFALKYLELIHLNETYSKKTSRADEAGDSADPATGGADKQRSPRPTTAVYYSQMPRANPNAVISHTPIIVSKRRIFFNVDHDSYKMKTNFPDVAGIYDPYKDPTYQSLVATNTIGMGGDMDDESINPYSQGYMMNENATFLLRKAFNLKAADGGYEDDDVIVYSSTTMPTGGRLEKHSSVSDDTRLRVNFDLSDSDRRRQQQQQQQHRGGGGGGSGLEDQQFVEELMIPISHEEECDIFDKFCQIYFTNDTIFALRVIQINASSLIVSEIVEFLWNHFKRLNLIITNEKNSTLSKRFYLIRKKQTKEKQKRPPKRPKMDPNRLTPPKFRKQPRQKNPEPRSGGILNRPPEKPARIQEKAGSYYENQLVVDHSPPESSADVPSSSSYSQTDQRNIIRRKQQSAGKDVSNQVSV